MPSRASSGGPSARTGLPPGLPTWTSPPRVVREALTALVSGADLGYPEWLHEAVPLREAFAGRMAERYGWSPDPAEVHEFSDIIQALQAVLHVSTAPGDAVAMHLPAYPPFLQTLAVMHRRLVEVPIERSTAGWDFDPERFARDVAASGARVLILVNPHNPTGRASPGRNSNRSRPSRRRMACSSSRTRSTRTLPTRSTCIYRSPRSRPGPPRGRSRSPPPPRRSTWPESGAR